VKPVQKADRHNGKKYIKINREISHDDDKQIKSCVCTGYLRNTYKFLLKNYTESKTDKGGLYYNDK
jgi:hypothetical protein